MGCGCGIGGGGVGEDGGKWLRRGEMLTEVEEPLSTHRQKLAPGIVLHLLPSVFFLNLIATRAFYADSCFLLSFPTVFGFG